MFHVFPFSHLFIFLFGPEAFNYVRIQMFSPAVHTLIFCSPLYKEQDMSRCINSESTAVIHLILERCLHVPKLTGKKLAIVFQSFFPMLQTRILRFSS